VSTKIFNGYRLEGAKSLADIMDFHKKAREKLLPLVEDATANGHVAATAILLGAIIQGEETVEITARDKFKLEYEFSFCWQVEMFYDKLQKQQERVYSGFDPNIRIGYGWSTNGQVLMMFFAHLRQMDEAWQEIPGVKEYGYWNNTDPLEGVSNEEWDVRCTEWDSVLPDYTPPSQSLIWQEIDAGHGVRWQDKCTVDTCGPIFKPEMFNWKLSEIKTYFDKNKEQKQ
jgi:hypothetical protein